MTETKFFTQAEARLTLPLVKKIIKDILDTTKEIRYKAESVEGVVEDDPEIKKLAADINGFIKELEEIGCYYRDWNFTNGVVDFPAIIDGQEVFLCWRSDEDDIKYYHGIQEDYAGRKLIP